MYNIAIVGATGNVGRKFLSILEERNFPINQLYLFASKKSNGTHLKFRGNSYLVQETSENNIKDKKIDYALFSAGGDASLYFAPLFTKYGTIVIDNSNAWRMNDDVPLVVPEVNPEDLKNHKGIIANPNCSTIQAMIPLKALKDNYGLKRIIYSTYQSVSHRHLQSSSSEYHDILLSYFSTCFLFRLYIVYSCIYILSHLWILRNRNTLLF